MTAVYLSIGSNIEPEDNINKTIELLGEFIDDIRVSPWYLTAPWGGIDQDDFLNIVVEGKTQLSPHELLSKTQAIEQFCERVRTIKNGPRTIDIDILLFGDEVIDMDELTVPHPGLVERDFMLIPLLDLNSELKDPQSGCALADAVKTIKYQQIIKRLGDTA